jgi:uncharacterized membrane protein YfcA
MTDILFYTIIILVSVLVGFINTLVGSGSLIMIPLLIAMGLPAHIANGTNRVAVFMQSAVGSITFFQKKQITIGIGWWSIVPSVLGALVGAWTATQIPPDSLEYMIGILLLVMLGVIMVNPERWLKTTQSDGAKSKGFLPVLLMVLVGFYGGFIQGGVGIFLLAALVLGVGYPMGHANALKMLIVLFYSLPVLLIFVWQGQVDWLWGLFTAMGQSVGAYLGAKFAATHKDADVWTYRLLVLIIIASIVQFYKLWEWVI